MRRNDFFRRGALRCVTRPSGVDVRSAIGGNFPRIDGREKVTGTAIYGTDLRVPGMLHGGVLRSPVPHARVRGIDAGRARSMPGDVRILKYVSVTDAGKMIQPLHCRGQDEGAAIFGIGLSLCEELVYRDGQLINPNLVDYRLPRFRDLPRTFTTRILEQGGGPGPYGAKGMGEGGILAAVPAICNGVYDAIGMRAYQVPLKGERVWRNLRRGALEKRDGN